MSFDTPADNRAFADAQGFPYRLLSDEDKQVGQAYGVLRAADDPFAHWPRRMTFLIRPDGMIGKVYEVTDVASHPDTVLADITAAAGH